MDGGLVGLAWETVLPGSGVPKSWSANNVVFTAIPQNFSQSDFNGAALAPEESGPRGQKKSDDVAGTRAGVSALKPQLESRSNPAARKGTALAADPKRPGRGRTDLSLGGNQAARRDLPFSSKRLPATTAQIYRKQLEREEP